MLVKGTPRDLDGRHRGNFNYLLFFSLFRKKHPLDDYLISWSCLTDVLAVTTPVKHGCDLKELSVYFATLLRNVPNGEINQQSFSNPTAELSIGSVTTNAELGELFIIIRWKRPKPLRKNSSGNSRSISNNHSREFPFRVASMAAVRYDLSGGLPTCLLLIIHQGYKVICIFMYLM